MYSMTTMASGAVGKPVKTQHVNVLSDNNGLSYCEKTCKYIVYSMTAMVSGTV